MELFLEQCKEKISIFLDSYLAEQQTTLRTVNGLADDTFDRLRAFVNKGKMVRGGLVFTAYSLAGKKPDETCLKLAVAMELIHTSLLIHDDIMDRDTMRRGEPTLFRQYQLWSRKQGSSDSDHLTGCRGVCLGQSALLQKQ
jgi:geranylgeranyl pyrophosphate synthase